MKEGFDSLDAADVERILEALIFASKDPIGFEDLLRHLPKEADAKAALQNLQARYAGRGVTLKEIGNAYAFRTAPDIAPYLRHHSVEQRKLSRAAVETLSIIAYHQPCTRAEIEEIRGVAVSKGTLDLLMELDWIKIGRRRETPGRPVTFLVTPAFLDHFDLSATKDLPGLAELRAAGLLESRPNPQAQLPRVGDDEGENEPDFDEDELIDEDDAR